MNPVVHWELFAKDAPALGRFYAELFGWRLEPMPEIGYVLIDTAAGCGANGGVATVSDGFRRPLFYVEVDDLQAALDAVRSAGGTMTLAPLTEVVTFAQVADPEGNIVGLLKRGDRSLVSSGDAAPVNRFHLAAAGPSTLAEFYRSVFGWQVRPVPTRHGPLSFDVRTGSSGIGGTIGSAAATATGVTFYACVEDLDCYVDRARALGATRAARQGEMACFVDPEGQTFGIERRA